MNCAKKDLLLYAVTDCHRTDDHCLYDDVKAALDGGATFVQLREKRPEYDAFYEDAAALRKLCRSYHVPFVINDDVEIALAVEADGVHVGQQDMAAEAARAKLGPDKILGVSAQTVEQAVLAEKQGADYLGPRRRVPHRFQGRRRSGKERNVKGHLRSGVDPGHCHRRHYKGQR